MESRTDGQIGRDRALEAMMSCDDEVTRRLLWRLAVKMNAKDRGAAIDNAATPLPLAGLFAERLTQPW